MQSLYGWLSGIYPGGYIHWEVLWVQNILLVLVQFTSGAALYEQDFRYVNWILTPVRFLTRRWDRRFLIIVHALSGVLIVVLNLACTGLWFYTRAGSVSNSIAFLFEAPVSRLGWINLLVTTMILVLGITGVSLYRKITPSTRLPLWSFNYPLSKILHRLSFVLLIGFLGYHLFFISRVSLIWMYWISQRFAFGVLSGTFIVLWTVMAGLAFLMVWEWLIGIVFSKATRSGGLTLSLVAIAGSAGIVLVIFLDLISPAYGSWVGLGVILLLMGEIVRKAYWV